MRVTNSKYLAVIGLMASMMKAGIDYAKVQRQAQDKQFWRV